MRFTLATFAAGLLGLAVADHTVTKYVTVPAGGEANRYANGEDYDGNNGKMDKPTYWSQDKHHKTVTVTNTNQYVTSTHTGWERTSTWIPKAGRYPPPEGHSKSIYAWKPTHYKYNKAVPTEYVASYRDMTCKECKKDFKIIIFKSVTIIVVREEVWDVHDGRTYKYTKTAYTYGAKETKAPIVVTVGGKGGLPLAYNPPYVYAEPGEVITFKFLAKNHSLTQSSFDKPCGNAWKFDTGFVPNLNNDDPAPLKYFTVPMGEKKPIWFYCKQGNHCSQGMVFAINPGNKFDTFLWKSKTAGNGAAPGSPNDLSKGGSVKPPPGPEEGKDGWHDGKKYGDWKKGKTYEVTVGGPGGQPLAYNPPYVNAKPGDRIAFKFLALNHTATESAFFTPCLNAKIFDTDFVPNKENLHDNKFIKYYEVRDDHPHWFYCRQGNHCSKGMVFAVNPGSEWRFRQFEARSKTKDNGAPDGSPNEIQEESDWQNQGGYGGNKPPVYTGKVWDVKVGGPDGLPLAYYPSYVDAKVGDRIRFNFGAKNHTATESKFNSPCLNAKIFDTDFVPNPDNKSGKEFVKYYDVVDSTPHWFYCRQGNHCSKGMVFAVNPGSKDRFNDFLARSKSKWNGAPAGSPNDLNAPPPTTTSSAPGQPAYTPPGKAYGKEWKVTVGGPGGQPLAYNPPFVNAEVGDKVIFEFLALNHTTTESSFKKPCFNAKIFDTDFVPNKENKPGITKTYYVNDKDPHWFYCKQGNHCSKGMVFSVNPGSEEKFNLFLARSQTKDNGAPPGSPNVIA